MQNITGGLDLSKGFNYINQDLDNVHNSADEITDINHKKMETNLGMSISTEQPSDDEIRKYIKSLNSKDLSIMENLNNQGYSFNDAVAYMNNKDQFSNPMANGNGIFVKKYQPSNTRTGIRRVEGAVLGPELLGQSMYSLGSTISNWVDKPTKRDVERGITDEIHSNRFEYAKSEYDKVTKEISKLKEGDEKLEGLKERQKYWANEMDKYNNGKRMSTLNAFEDQGVSGTNYEKAVGAGTKEYELWQKEVQPAFDAATTNYRKIDFIDKLTKDRFPDINEAKWKEFYEPIIKKWKKTYSTSETMDLKGLREWKNTYKPSNDNINGNLLDTKEGAYRRLEDEMHNMLTEQVKKDLEYTKPGAGSAYEEYSRLEEGFTDVQKGAVRDAKADKTIKGEVKKKAKGWASNTANKLKKIGQNIKPSTWLEKGATKLGLPAETVDGIVKTAEGGEKFVSKAWKGGGKLLATLAPILDAVAIGEELANTDERYQLMPTVIGLSQKALWKKGMAKGAYYENYTEEDWEREGLGQDVVRAYLDSEEFERYLELTAYNSILFGLVETNSRDRLRNSYRDVLYY